MTESLIKSSSATSSNSETGYSDNPKIMLPPRYRLIWPLTFRIKGEHISKSMFQQGNNQRDRFEKLEY